MTLFKLTIVFVSIKSRHTGKPSDLLSDSFVLTNVQPGQNCHFIHNPKEAEGSGTCSEDVKKTPLRYSTFVLSPTKKNKTEGKEIDGE